MSALTPRERQVVDMLVDGHTLADIGRELGLSSHTVRNHVKACFRKYGVHRQSQLVAAVMRDSTVAMTADPRAALLEDINAIRVAVDRLAHAVRISCRVATEAEPSSEPEDRTLADVRSHVAVWRFMDEEDHPIGKRLTTALSALAKVERTVANG